MLGSCTIHREGLKLIKMVSFFVVLLGENIWQRVAFQSNANHPLAEGTGYIKFEGM